MNYKLGSYTAQLRSEARNAATRRRDALKDNDNMLYPLTEEEKNLFRSRGINLNNSECISTLEDFFNLGKIPAPVQENDSDLLVELKNIFKNKKWVDSLPKPKNEEEKNNLIQNVLCMAGLDFLKSREEFTSLPEFQNIIAKFLVDPDYRLCPLSEDEKRWLVALGIDVNDAECTTYLADFLEKRKKTALNDIAQKEKSVNKQRRKNKGPPVPNRPNSSQDNESSLLTKLKKILQDSYWVNNLPEPRDEAEKNNMIQNILYKAGIEDVDDGEFDSLLILPDSRQIIGKFQSACCSPHVR